MNRSAFDVPAVWPRTDDEELSQYQRVHIRPFADLQRLSFVQVLTRSAAASAARAQSP